MGWAARAKVRTGNPVPATIGRRTFLDAAKHAALFEREPHATGARLECSDRDYLVDRHATLRRVSKPIALDTERGD